jgi:hypothetical protein
MNQKLLVDMDVFCGIKNFDLILKLIPIFNKNSPRAHMELEFDMLGVHGKLVKYAIHSSKKNLKKFIFLYTSCPNNN